MTAPLTSGETALPEAQLPTFETPPTGLTAAEVQERVARGAVNDTGERTSRTVGEIVRANVFTRFNAILGAMLAVIVVVGPIQDATFGLVLFANAAIGIIQEVARQAHARSARGVERATRSGRPRRQRRRRSRSNRSCSTTCSISAPATRSRATASLRNEVGLDIDESLLTGESDPVDKHPGDEVLSGSFVVARAAAGSRPRASVPIRTRARSPPRRAGSSSRARS